jgi:hypothetical protein
VATSRLRSEIAKPHLRDQRKTKLSLREGCDIAKDRVRSLFMSREVLRIFWKIVRLCCGTSELRCQAETFVYTASNVRRALETRIPVRVIKKTGITRPKAREDRYQSKAVYYTKDNSLRAGHRSPSLVRTRDSRDFSPR